MVASLVAYIVGCLLSLLSLGMDREEYKALGSKERCKAFLGTVGMSLLWPAAGVWFLWELFDVWRTSMRGPREGENL